MNKPVFKREKKSYHINVVLLIVMLAIVVAGSQCLFTSNLLATSHTFFYPSTDPNLTVSVAGSFNEWSEHLNPMHYDPSKKGYVAEVELAPGTYEYKFVVNGQWLLDPTNKATTNKSGFTNSLLVIPAPAELSEARRGDARLFTQYIIHKPGRAEFLNNDQGRYYFMLQTLKNDAETAYIVFNARETYPMSYRGAGRVFDYFTFYYTHKTPAQYDSYYFLITDADTQFKTKSYFLAQAKSFSTPVWVRGAVLYQIFPERFYNGNAENDPASVQPWGTQPTYSNFMGGDLEGIVQKISYIKSLIIDGIYLNPIFLSPSNHKYNTTDYFIVDPHLGGNTAFSKLINALKNQNIKLILDGVFNHTGTQFFQFKDVVSRGPKSKYKDWYYFHSFPVVKYPKPNYECWWGFSELPKLNTKNPKVQNFILSVAKYWTQQGIDGWRLDVANEVYYPFWRRFRKTIKKMNPEMYIVGEIWGNGQKWLQGDMFDAVMNYRLRNLIINFFIYHTSSPQKFVEDFVDLYYSYAPQAQAVMFNMLGSHDVPRINSLASDKKWLKDAIAFLFVQPGAAVIYYGDEIGMKGGRDPDNRQCFVWQQERWDTELLNLHRQLSKFRRQHRKIYLDPRVNIGFKNGVLKMTITNPDTPAVIVYALNTTNQTKVVDTHIILPKEYAVWSSEL